MLRKFLSGRYGMDNLTLAIALLSAILLNIDYVWIIGVGLLGYAIFRVTSRNIAKRKEELQRFESVVSRVRLLLAPASGVITRGFMSLYKTSMNYSTRIQQRKLFVFVKCTKCKKTLRLPKNKGKLLATCPVCKSEFTMKT